MIKIIKFSKVILVLSIFTILQCAEQFKEELFLEYLPDTNKHLISLKQDYIIEQKFDKIDSNVGFLSRSVLENIFIASNTTNFRIESACGSVNQIYLDESDIGQNFHFPQNGVVVVADSGTYFQVLLQSLGEVFKLTKTTIKNQNHFQVKNNITQVQDESNIFSKDYIYSQDPTDFICVNNIEQLRIYLPCGGKKGLMSIIDQTNLFASDYISIVSDFYYDRINDQIKATIVINAIVPLQNYREFLADEKQIKLNCPIFQSSFISIDSYGIFETGKISVKDLDYNVEKLFDMIDTKQNKQNIQKYKNKLADLKSNQILKSNRYMGDRWTDFQGFLVHELVNNDQKRTIQIISSEFLIWQCQPVLHQIQIIRDDLYEDKQINYTLTVEENQSYLFQFYIDIKPQEKVRIIIPMNKLMKSFENYPHDPQRGHDIISGSIVYSFKNDLNDQKVKHQSSQNLLIRLPEPDFSMPFNIITYVCVLLGYVFLSIFQNSTKRPKIDQ